MHRPILLAFVLALCGCPAADDPYADFGVAPPMPKVDALELAATAAPVQESRTPEPADCDPALRAQLLSLSPESVLRRGVAGRGPLGLASGLAGSGALALCEQLRGDGTPKEALALASVIFRRAAEQTAPGEPASPAVIERLNRSIAIQAGDQPRLSEWLPALQRASTSREDLAAAATFLGQAYLVWQAVDQTQALTQAVRKS